MLKKYHLIAPAGEVNIGPDNKLLQSILNYSMSIEVKGTRKNKVLIHLN